MTLSSISISQGDGTFAQTLAWLRSEAGEQLMTELSARRATGAGLLQDLTWLRERVPAAVAAVAMEQAELRERAAEKFADAHRMFFVREALEQATNQVIADYRAQRFASFAHVWDLCCGIGGDALALARAGHNVTAVDRDPDRLAALQANAQVLELSDRILIRSGEVTADSVFEPADAVFCDPSRRAAGRRKFDPGAYDPPLSQVLRWNAGGVAVKLGPGIPNDALDAVDVPHETEFISLDGALKEAVLWFGRFAQHGGGRRATVLRRRRAADGGQRQAECFTLFRAADSASPDAPAASEPLATLYEPDPAVIRAQLLLDLAIDLGAVQIDRSIAYLTSSEKPKPTPFARALPILEWMPFNLKRLRARLRELDAGEVTVKKRGSALDTDAMARALRGPPGGKALVVVLTLVRGNPAAIVCRPGAPTTFIPEY